MPVNESAGDFKIKAHNEAINEFVRECKDYLEQLEAFKKHVKAIVPIKELEVQYYKEFSDFLSRYEETNTKRAKPSDPPVVHLVTGESRIDIKQKLVDNASTVRNPFKHVRNWIKGEMLEIQCVLESISRKEGVEANRSKAVSNVKNSKETVDKMNQGKFTLKGLFKSQSGRAAETQNILQSISQSERDIQNYEIIKNFLVVYIAEIAIPAFKAKRQGDYLRAMAAFCDQEISNARTQSSTWTDFLEAVKQTASKQGIQIKGSSSQVW
jgi:hypothetical protein